MALYAFYTFCTLYIFTSYSLYNYMFYILSILHTLGCFAHFKYYGQNFVSTSEKYSGISRYVKLPIVYVNFDAVGEGVGSVAICCDIMKSSCHNYIVYMCSMYFILYCTKLIKGTCVQCIVISVFFHTCTVFGVFDEK